MDEIDRAEANIEKFEADAIGAARKAAADIPAGESGECEYCGDYFDRIVSGACGRCRDEFNIK